MWYVIRTTTGREHEVCLWINTFIYRKHYRRCFVLLYEDVWKKQGIGHISAKKLFPGYLFIESDEPEEQPKAREDVRSRLERSRRAYDSIDQKIKKIRKIEKTGNLKICLVSNHGYFDDHSVDEKMKLEWLVDALP